MILFTADHHLKLGQKAVPIEWAKSRYRQLFEQIHNIPCNLHIMGGDIFDKLPNMDELELYFEFIRSCRVETLIYSGNHEATKKGKTFFSALKNVTNAVNPLVNIIDTPLKKDNFTILPYEYIHKKENWDNIDTNIVFSHVRGEIPPHVKSEIPLEWLSRFNTVYLGDLHSHSNSQLNLVYPGSPVTTSFHRNKVETGYLLIDNNNLTSWTWHKFDLPQLIRKTVSDPSEMIPTTPDHTIYELEGSITELSGIKNNELLDKKLVKRSTDTTLILSKELSIAEELAEYMCYVLELPEDEIAEVISIFHDYTKKT